VKGRPWRGWGKGGNGEMGKWQRGKTRKKENL